MSTPASQVATPFQEPTSAASPLQTLQFVVKQTLNNTRTATLVQVQAVYPPSAGVVGKVDVLPLINQVDGAGNVIQQKTLYGRPYLRIFGGNNAFICDPQVNDIGLMVFCDRDISAVVKSLGSSPPGSRRRFNFADGVYLFGLPSQMPTNYVEIATDGTIKVVSTVAIDLQAPAVNITTTGNVNINGAIISTAGEVTDALGKVLGTHLHSGVTGGTSDTGPPV